MDWKAAVLTFALAAGADEASTRYMQKHGGIEAGGLMGPQSTKVRLIIKGSMLPLYIATQKKSKFVRFGVPAAFVLAGAWNVKVAQDMKRRAR